MLSLFQTTATSGFNLHTAQSTTLQQHQYGFTLNFLNSWGKVKCHQQCYSADIEDPPTSNPKNASSSTSTTTRHDKHNDSDSHRNDEDNSKERRFKNFDELLEKNNDKLVLVDFYAKWCGPCRVARKELDTVRHTFDDLHEGNPGTPKDNDEDHGLIIFSVDTGRFPKLGSRFNITELPAILLFKDGSEVHRFHGLGESTAEQIVPLLKQHL